MLTRPPVLLAEPRVTGEGRGPCVSTNLILFLISLPLVYHGSTYTVEEALDHIGFGVFQVRLLILGTVRVRWLALISTLVSWILCHALPQLACTGWLMPWKSFCSVSSLLW